MTRDEKERLAQHICDVLEDRGWMSFSAVVDADEVKGLIFDIINKEAK